MSGSAPCLAPLVVGVLKEQSECSEHNSPIIAYNKPAPCVGSALKEQSECVEHDSPSTCCNEHHEMDILLSTDPGAPAVPAIADGKPWQPVDAPGPCVVEPSLALQLSGRILGAKHGMTPHLHGFGAGAPLMLHEFSDLRTLDTSLCNNPLLMYDRSQGYY